MHNVTIKNDYFFTYFNILSTNNDNFYHNKLFNFIYLIKLAKAKINLVYVTFFIIPPKPLLVSTRLITNKCKMPLHDQGSLF